MGSESEQRKAELPDAQIGKFLDCSTCHITSSDALMLKNDARIRGEDCLIVYAYAEGFFVHVNHDMELFVEQMRRLAARNYSNALDHLLRLARSLDCWFLRLDADGAAYEGLETFEW